MQYKKVYITFRKPVEYDMYGSVKSLYNMYKKPPGFSRYGVLDLYSGILWDSDNTWTVDFRIDVTPQGPILRIFNKVVPGNLVQRQWAYLKRSLKGVLNTYKEVRFPKLMDHVYIALVYDALYDDFDWKLSLTYMYRRLESDGYLWGNF